MNSSQRKPPSKMQIKSLIREDLLPLIANIDSERAKAKKIGYFCLLTLISGGYWAWKYGEGKLIDFLPLIIGLVICFFAPQKFDSYRRKYKQIVIDRLLKKLYPKFKFKHESFVDMNRFYESGLFSKNISSYSGEDYVKGQVGQTDVEFSEISAYRENKWHESDSKEVLVFGGIFFIADFHKHIQGKTYLIPMGKEKSFDPETARYGEPISIEDPSLTYQYMIRSDSGQEARYILTPKMQENISLLVSRLKTPIAFSFHGGKVYVAVFNVDHFEPQQNRPANEKDIQNYLLTLKSILDIVNDLDLNTRIWSKE